MRAIVVGGGVGGLTTAIALRRNGIDACVFDRARDLKHIQVGGGIHLWSNAMRVMQDLSLADAVRDIGTECERQEFYSWHNGMQLCNWPVGDLARRLGAPTVGVSRADIHGVLSSALDKGVLQLDSLCTNFTQDSTGVTVYFANGREERGDVLIGADGINSVVRSQLLGYSKPRYAGYTIWQAILDFEHPDLPLGVFRMLWGPGRKFTVYHVGQGRLYWFASANAPAGGQATDKQMLLDLYRGFLEPTEAVIEATDQKSITRMDHFDRKPVKHWGTGRVTLLGDAAHAMTLNLGQGACMAVEDALVLAQHLRAEGDPVAALRAYEAVRIPRANRLVKIAWRMGIMGKWENPVACLGRDRFMKLVFDGFLWNEHSKTMSYELVPSGVPA